MKSPSGSDHLGQSTRRSTRDRVSVKTVRSSERRGSRTATTQRRSGSRNSNHDVNDTVNTAMAKREGQGHAHSAKRGEQSNKNTKNTMDGSTQRQSHHGRHGPNTKTTIDDGDGTSELEFRQKSRILEVLHAFKEDVVTVKSSQRNKWQEKLDSLQQQRCSSQMSLNPNPGSLSGFETHEVIDVDPKRPNSGIIWTKPSKKEHGDNGNSRNSSASLSGLSLEHPVDPCGDRVRRICHYSSGILAGILLWQTVFGVLFVQEMGSAYRLLYWSSTTALVLVTVIGFLVRICIIPGDVSEFQPGKFILHLSACLVLLTFHYLNKAIDLQSQECTNYLKINNEEQQSQIQLSYPCQDDNQPLTTQSVRFVLSLVPALGALVIYTYLHIAKD